MSRRAATPPWVGAAALGSFLQEWGTDIAALEARIDALVEEARGKG